jgi:hypothetical protein
MDSSFFWGHPVLNVKLRTTACPRIGAIPLYDRYRIVKETHICKKKCPGFKGLRVRDY